MNLPAIRLLPVIIVGFVSVAHGIHVGKYKTHELVFTTATSPANPFDSYLLKLEVTDPVGEKFTVDGFYDGDGNGGQNGNIWKARLSPYMTGVWSWRTVPSDAPDPALTNLSGQFNCVESGDLGGMVAEDQHFRVAAGDYFFLVGNFLDSTVAFTHVFMSEELTDADRNAVVARHQHFHTANKMNLYFANQRDYGGMAVTPWLGTAASNDKRRMDLARWKLYDNYIRRLKDARMLAEMWFFADGSDFGGLSQADKNRLFRYAMARTSAFSHTIYVIALEWEEDWSHSSITQSGDFLQVHNPWGRPVSVHSLTGSSWDFVEENWATFIASQPGNDESPATVNGYTIAMREHPLPHVAEEFGHLNGASDTTLRAKLWAALLGGAAGAGTGSDLKAFQRFLVQSRAPLQRMAPANGLVEEGGSTRFVLSEIGHHYIVYSLSGSFRLSVTGSSLRGRWFNPRHPGAWLGNSFAVPAGSQILTPPFATDEDWVLWISDESNLRSGVGHPSPGAILTHEIVKRR